MLLTKTLLLVGMLLVAQASKSHAGVSLDIAIPPYLTAKSYPLLCHTLSSSPDASHNKMIKIESDLDGIFSNGFGKDNFVYVNGAKIESHVFLQNSTDWQGRGSKLVELEWVDSNKIAKANLQLKPFWGKSSLSIIAEGQGGIYMNKQTHSIQCYVVLNCPLRDPRLCSED